MYRLYTTITRVLLTMFMHFLISVNFQVPTPQKVNGESPIGSSPSLISPARIPSNDNHSILSHKFHGSPSRNPNGTQKSSSRSLNQSHLLGNPRHNGPCPHSLARNSFGSSLVHAPETVNERSASYQVCSLPARHG
jgi:hypothetical protein